VNQSIQCLSDATSLLQVADSSLSSIQDILLKMKGLATQGLDGSLNANQRLDIANQLDDLNSEINATAQRAKFNGIGIIASGSSVDTANSSIKIGAALSTEALSDFWFRIDNGIISENMREFGEFVYEKILQIRKKKAEAPMTLQPRASNIPISLNGSNLSIASAIPAIPIASTPSVTLVSQVNPGESPKVIENEPPSQPARLAPITPAQREFSFIPPFLRKK